MAQDNKEQKKLLTEVMNEDAKNGLYDRSVDSNKMVTAVEWFCNNISFLDIRPKDTLKILKVYEQAKQMEKDLIAKAWNDGNLLGRNGFILEEYSNGEQYYNETYGK